MAIATEPSGSAPKVQPRRRSPVVPAVLGLSFVALVALACYSFWPTADAPLPVVMITSPSEDQQVQVGQDVTLQAVARGQARIVRAELWVDGELWEVERSGLSGGVSPLPIVATWRPETPGQHALIARAFDRDGGRSTAAVTVTAIESADRDKDGVLDGDDSCPDEPGWVLTRGCPDRDGNAIVDAEDACPDQAGTTGGNGCPQPVEGDRDGDSVADSADASPDTAGSAALDGRPVPAPSEGGRLPSDTTGSPAGDADGDGVADDIDLCPEAPGPLVSGGCPPSGAGDRDEDGVADDVDLAPDEAGLAEHGGCPPPGEGRDRDGSGIPDEEELPHASLVESLMLLLPFRTMPAPKAPVEFEILEFGTHQLYDEVTCYVRLQDGPVLRVEPGYTGGLSWDVAALGGARRGVMDIPEGEAAAVHVECAACRFSSMGTEGDLGDGRFGGGGSEVTYYDLGTLDALHTAEEWDGRRLLSVSVRDADPVGRVFHMAYRICQGSCAESPLPAPRAALLTVPKGGTYVTWQWDGDESRIEKFTLRGQCREGSCFIRTVAKEERAVLVDSIAPECGQSCSYTVTAESDSASSPASNVVVWDGEPCPGMLCVDFDMLSTFNHPDSSMCGRGPLYGQFWANRKLLSFDAVGRFWGGEGMYDGLSMPVSSYGPDCGLDIQQFFDRIRALRFRDGTDAYSAPASSRVCIPMQADTDLTIGMRILEENPEGPPTILADSVATIPAAHLLSDDFNDEYEEGDMRFSMTFYSYILRDDLCSLYVKLAWQDRPPAAP